MTLSVPYQSAIMEGKPQLPVERLGLHNQRTRNINQLQPGTLQANPGVNPNFLRPFRGMGIIGISENSGTSTYNDLQVSVERRFSSGPQFGAAYTLSRAYDNSSDLTDTLPNAYDDRAYWASRTSAGRTP